VTETWPRSPVGVQCGWKLAVDERVHEGISTYRRNREPGARTFRANGSLYLVDPLVIIHALLCCGGLNRTTKTKVQLMKYRCAGVPSKGVPYVRSVDFEAASRYFPSQPDVVDFYAGFPGEEVEGVGG
jgi:hypothetical protein